jgi:hypothetical protein
MAEWSNAAVLKTAGLTAPGVRIPLPPLTVVYHAGIREYIESKCSSGPLRYKKRDEKQFDSGRMLFVEIPDVSDACSVLSAADRLTHQGHFDRR